MSGKSYKCGWCNTNQSKSNRQRHETTCPGKKAAASAFKSKSTKKQTQINSFTITPPEKRNKPDEMNDIPQNLVGNDQETNTEKSTTEKQSTEKSSAVESQTKPDNDDNDGTTNPDNDDNNAMTRPDNDNNDAQV